MFAAVGSAVGLGNIRWFLFTVVLAYVLSQNTVDMIQTIQTGLL